jgi:hypothetical protein
VTRNEAYSTKDRVTILIRFARLTEPSIAQFRYGDSFGSDLNDISCWGDLRAKALPMPNSIIEEIPNDLRRYADTVER